jgi:hypothetical protein
MPNTEFDIETKMATLSMPKTRMKPIRTAPVIFGGRHFSGRNQGSDPLRSEASPSIGKLSLKGRYRNWQN